VTHGPVVIGAGPNGLACAFVLARAGLRPIVLERAERVGGAAITAEVEPGVRVPMLAHACDALREDLAREMQLERRGVGFLRPRVASFTPRHDGAPLVIARDVAETVGHLRTTASEDAERWPAFHEHLSAMAKALAPLLEHGPPSVDQPGVRDAWPLVRAARPLRALGRRRLYDLLRALPMSAADLLGDWFSSDALRATLATRALVGSALGPRAAGTAGLLLLAAARQPGSPLSPTFVAGGPGALTAAMAEAVREAGGEIRTSASVSRILDRDGRVAGVALETGETIETHAVLSGADPHQTLLDLLDPAALDPTVRWRLGNYRAHGTLAKVNLVLEGLPSFNGVPDAASARQLLSGRIVLAAGIDELDRACDAAKYGELARRPWLECTIPSLTDPSLTPEGTHVMSIYVQAMPYTLREGGWDQHRERVREVVIDRLAEHAPDLPDRMKAAQVLTPVDLERELGTTGGHIHHGDMALDQMYAMRPIPSCAQYRTPVEGLYLCCAGTHPGGGITGHSGVNAARTFLRDRRRSAG
jgi:phytoene dehydrogenase-like protein